MVKTGVIIADFGYCLAYLLLSELQNILGCFIKPHAGYLEGQSDFFLTSLPYGLNWGSKITDFVGFWGLLFLYLLLLEI